MIKPFAAFLLINFAGLALGSVFTSSGVASDWYNSLSKAPWTPPGFVFGLAWTTIMICWAFFLALIWNKIEQKSTLVGLYIAQWILNFIWNPVFFKYQLVGAGMIIIVGLTLLMAYIYYHYKEYTGKGELLLLPYLVWLVIASSLNIYIWWYN